MSADVAGFFLLGVSSLLALLALNINGKIRRMEYIADKLFWTLLNIGLTIVSAVFSAVGLLTLFAIEFLEHGWLPLLIQVLLFITLSYFLYKYAYRRFM